MLSFLSSIGESIQVHPVKATSSGYTFSSPKMPSTRIDYLGAARLDISQSALSAE